MKTNVQQTSIFSYHELNNLGARQQAVLRIIRERPISNLEIAQRLNLPINSITPRTNELVAKGLVKEAYRDISPVTDRQVIFWEATNV